MWSPKRPPLLARITRSGMLRQAVPRAGLPRIVRFLAFHCLMGTTLGAVFAGLLMLINIGGLMDLIATSEQPALPIAMLVIGCALTFGSATMAAAVMSIDPDE